MHFYRKIAGALVISSLLILGLSACAQDTKAKEKTKNVQTAAITVTILGSGTPIPSAEQFGASILVQAGGYDLLFDCGRGCTTRLVKIDRQLVSGIEHLFLTHLHSDHIVGVDDLWLNGWTQGRNAPLEVYGPTGTLGFFTNLRAAFTEDIKIRLKKGLPTSDDGISLTMTDMTQDRIVFDKDGILVTAFLVDHRPVDPAFGYRIDYAGKSVAISGDTKPSENLVKNSMGVDVLLHEVMSPTQVAYIRNKFTAEQFKSIVGIHTTVEQAADIFTETSPKLAVYYHTSNTTKDVSALIDETRKLYDGALEVGQDLLQIKIGNDIKTSVLE